VDDARRKLVSWISHDLRTPLGRVRAIVEALNDGLVYKSAEVASYHAQLSDEIERLTTLVNDLFELNRISAGALELELECVDIGELVTELAGSFAVVADSRSITLNATDLSLDAAADVSPRHLERALSNLLDNALRYTHAGGAVDVSVLRSATNVQVAIDDTCGGTDVEMLATILAAPAEQTVLGSSGRTGLGLGIAQGLVQAQGGQIDVERTGRGCRFTVTLQLAPSVNPLHAFAPL
jgi:signal transduction histidine kinase